MDFCGGINFSGSGDSPSGHASSTLPGHEPLDHSVYLCWGMSWISGPFVCRDLYFGAASSSSLGCAIHLPLARSRVCLELGRTAGIWTDHALASHKLPLSNQEFRGHPCWQWDEAVPSLNPSAQDLDRGIEPLWERCLQPGKGNDRGDKGNIVGKATPGLMSCPLGSCWLLTGSHGISKATP